MEKKSEQRRSGLVVPLAERYRDHDARPLADHLADFQQYLTGKGGRSTDYPPVTANRARKVLGRAKAVRIADLSVSAATNALATLRGEGLGAERVNHHVRPVKMFSRWLWREGRSREHFLAHLSTQNSESDRRRERRALTPDEAGRLIEAAHRGRFIGNMTGPDRAMLYRLALGTGFRAMEIASLTPESFDFDRTPATVTCAAGYTKNGREAAQPIGRDLSAILKPWVASKPTGKPVFAVPDRKAQMLRVDLKAAGIEYRDPAGNYLDFHALRHKFVSWLVAGKVSVKVAQTPARHSTPTLTIQIYAKATAADVADAVQNFPGFPGPKAE